MDARSLLRAQKATTKIEHPYATYSASGQLRCTICAAPVQQWDAHLLTKQHRTSVQREKAQQAKAQQAAAKRQRVEAESSASAAKKVRIQEPEPEPETETAMPEASSSKSALPAGFFSDPSQQPALDDDEEEEDNDDVKDVPLPKETGDAELDDFFASLSAPPLDSAEDSAEPVASKAASRRRLKELDQEELDAQTTYSSAAVRTDAPAGSERAVNAPVPVEETEAEKRARIAREEKEEIMSRLLEEERAQEDADERVASLKARMEAVKARRKALAEAGGAKANGKAKKK